MAKTLSDAYNWYFDGKIKASEFDSDRVRTGFVFDMTALQRFMLLYLQSDVVYTTANLRTTTGQLDRKQVEKLLKSVHEYCT